MALLCAIRDPMGRGGHLWHVGGILPTIRKGVDKIGLCTALSPASSGCRTAAGKPLPAFLASPDPRLPR